MLQHNFGFILFVVNFDTNKTHHASACKRTPVGYFFQRVMNYTKPPISIVDQIALLINRGLAVPDQDRATQYLSNISYYRLRAYTYPFQDNALQNRPFNPGVDFDRILELYVFDRELRLVVFDAIERIEIALRTQIIHHFAMAYGSHWFENPALYKRTDLLRSDLRGLDKEIQRSSEAFIRHYQNKYASPLRPPAWMSLEVTTMGLLSKLFENLKMCAAKKQVTKHFGLGHPIVLESWMHTFSNVRNICAHHGRLWNRHLTQAPILPINTTELFLTNPIISPHQIYATLSCMVYLLRIINPGSHLFAKLKNHLTQNPSISLTVMGFPEGWQDEPLWN